MGTRAWKVTLWRETIHPHGGNCLFVDLRVRAYLPRLMGLAGALVWLSRGNRRAVDEPRRVRWEDGKASRPLWQTEPGPEAEGGRAVRAVNSQMVQSRQWLKPVGNVSSKRSAVQVMVSRQLF